MSEGFMALQVSAGSISEILESQQHLFDTGHEIGQLAQQYFDKGIEIKDEYFQIDQSIKSTEKAIEDGYKTIYETTACSPDNAFSKIDILRKANGSNAWELIEVKGSISVKDYHIGDSAPHSIFKFDHVHSILWNCNLL